MTSLNTGIDGSTVEEVDDETTDPDPSGSQLSPMTPVSPSSFRAFGSEGDLLKQGSPPMGTGGRGRPPRLGEQQNQNPPPTIQRALTSPTRTTMQSGAGLAGSPVNSANIHAHGGARGKEAATTTISPKFGDGIKGMFSPKTKSPSNKAGLEVGNPAKGGESAGGGGGEPEGPVKQRTNRRIAVQLPTQKWSIFEQEEEIASTLFDAIRTEYHHQYMSKELDDDALYFLDEALNQGRDYLKATQGGTINQALVEQLDQLVKLLPIPIAPWLEQLEDVPLFGRFAKRIIFHRVYSSLEALSGFIRAHQNLIDVCKRDGRLVDPVPVITPVIQGAQYEITQMEAEFGTLMHIQRIVLTARTLTMAKKEFIVDKQQRGLLNESDVEKLTGCLDRTVTKLQAVRFNTEISSSCRKYHKERHGTKVSLA